MLYFMIDSRARHRIGQLVSAVMAWEGLTGVGIDSAGRVSRATVNRVKRGDRVSDDMLRALGRTLGLPRDYLLYVGTGDIEKIQSSGADPDLVRVTIDMIRSESNELRGIEGRE